MNYVKERNSGIMHPQQLRLSQKCSCKPVLHASNILSIIILTNTPRYQQYQIPVHPNHNCSIVHRCMSSVHRELFLKYGSKFWLTSNTTNNRYRSQWQ